MRQKIFWFSFLVFVVPLAALVFYHFVIDSRRAIDFEVSQGYVGEVRVNFSIVGASPLPIRGGHYIARVPASGILKTSTAQDDGWGADRYYYVNQKGQRTPIDGFKTNINLIQNETARTNDRIMFIGTRQQARSTNPPIVVEPKQMSNDKPKFNGSPFQVPPTTQTKK